MFRQVFRNLTDSGRILLLSRSVMTESAIKDCLQPPARVKGITELDKELFREKITIPCLPIPARVVGRVHGLKSVRKFGVPRMNRVKTIFEGQNKEEKLILFNPNGLTESVKEQVVSEILNVTDIEKSSLVFGSKEIELNYEDWDIKRCFKAVLPEGLEFSGFSQIGHIAHCNLRPELLPYKKVIASILIDKTAWCKTVVNKVDEINTKFRFFEMELLAGEERYVTELKEGKVRFRLDFSKLFWNSRLGTEHSRLIEKFKSRSIVYDACAGVGPFAIPAALNGVKRVLANDLNPESVKYLSENVELNKAPSISVFNKDACEFIRNEVAEDLTKEFALPFEERANDAHILMNLPALAVTFLPAFRRFLKVKPNFPIIVHCHLFAKAHEDVPDEFYPAEAKRMVLESLGVEEEKIDIIEVHNVRKVAGRKEMFCVSFELPEDYVLDCGDSAEPEAKRANMLRRCVPQWVGVVEQRRGFNALPFKVYSIRRRIAEFTANKFELERVAAMGPDLACLEWLMECGSTKVTMSCGAEITTIAAMRKYIESNGFDVRRLPSAEASISSAQKKGESELIYNSRWKHVPGVHIVEVSAHFPTILSEFRCFWVDASDSAIANPGFAYFGQCRRIEKLKMNFCDYFGDEGIRELALGRPAKTLKDLEIVINPSVSDASLYWLVQLKSLRRLHMYFLPYVANRAALLRQLRISLPKCKVTFPEVDKVGYGYED